MITITVFLHFYVAFNVLGNVQVLMLEYISRREMDEAKFMSFCKISVEDDVDTLEKLNEIGLDVLVNMFCSPAQQFTAAQFKADLKVDIGIKPTHVHKIYNALTTIKQEVTAAPPPTPTSGGSRRNLNTSGDLTSPSPSSSTASRRARGDQAPPPPTPASSAGSEGGESLASSVDVVVVEAPTSLVLAVVPVSSTSVRSGQSSTLMSMSAGGEFAYDSITEV